MAQRRGGAFLLCCLFAGLVSLGNVTPVLSRGLLSLSEQEEWSTPSSKHTHKKPPCSTPSGGSTPTPSHGGGGSYGTPTPSTPSHGGGGSHGTPTPSTPSHGGGGSHGTPTPTPSHGSGGYYNPPSGGGGHSSPPVIPPPTTPVYDPPVVPTPTTPVYEPPTVPTPTTPGSGYYPPVVPTPTAPVYEPPTIPTPTTPVYDPPAAPTPTTPGSGYYPPVVPTPTTPVYDPPALPTPTTPGSGYYPPVVPTPTTPVYDPPAVPTPTTPGSGYYPPVVPTPYTPTPIISTPPSPTTIDPNVPPYSPGTCNYWSTHPGAIWAIFGYWGTIGGLFGPACASAFGSPLDLHGALTNMRTDGIGSLYREGTAALLNSMVCRSFPLTASQVKQSFAAAVGSDRAAAQQAQLFQQANEGRFKSR